MVTNKYAHTPAPVRGKRRASHLAALGLFAGCLNGLLGTGGGMVLALGLARLFPREEAKNLSISTASVLVFSIMSTILYGLQGHIPWENVAAALPPALMGGVLGALLLGRLPGRVLTLLLALMLLYSGVMLLW